MATTTSMLEQEDKSIDKIHQILVFTEAKFINKLATGVTRNLTMMS